MAPTRLPASGMPLLLADGSSAASPPDEHAAVSVSASTGDGRRARPTRFLVVASWFFLR